MALHPWISTYSGRQFYPTQPSLEQLDIVDIAHALSMQCRFNGHVTRFYSVAEHCLYVSRLVAPEAALRGLLHDAAEAYLSDIPAPLKPNVPWLVDREDAIMLSVEERFGYLDDGQFARTNVNLVDKWIVYEEAKALFRDPSVLKDWPPQPKFSPPLKIDWAHAGLAPSDAKHFFLQRFAELAR